MTEDVKNADANAPKKLSIQRRTKTTVSSTTAGGKAKAVQVEVRKKRTVPTDAARKAAEAEKLKAQQEAEKKAAEEAARKAAEEAAKKAAAEEAAKKAAAEEAEKQQTANSNKPSASTGNGSSQKPQSGNQSGNTNINNNNSNNNNSNNSEKIDFNDDLKKQIAVAGEAYVEFYFEYGEGTAPSAFAEQAYEDTENDTPLGEYKEQGKTIFMNAFKEAYEATGNEYY